ncbi:uncharacterized protein ZBIST_2337 [Zygosaccharomyces bailii]|nr:uncharacterized protein ZBIST_2337 [Zygosaccharomyces bailii]
MNEYPVITVPKGQFVVIDGFLVKLGTEEKDQNETFLRDARNLLTFEGWSILRNSFYPNTLLKMREMRSNYYLSHHRAFFQLMKSKTYVIFIRKQGRYCCRRVDRSRATHVALSVKLGPKGQRLKYVVFDKPLSKSDHRTHDLYQQQNQDLHEIENTLIKNAPPFDTVDRENAILQNVLFVTEDQLGKLKGYPITEAKLELIERNNDRPRLDTLLELKKSLLRICLESSFWQLKRLRDRCDHDGMQDIFEDCKNQIQEVLPIVSEQNFPQLIQQWFDEKISIQDISSRYVVIENFVVDLESKSLVDPQNEEWLANLSALEKEQLESTNPLDWNVLKLCKEAYPVYNRKLFDLAESTEKNLFRDSSGGVHILEPEGKSTDVWAQFTCRCIIVNFQDFGPRVLYENVEITDAAGRNTISRGESIPTFVVPKTIGDKRYDYLLKNLDFFVSFNGLKTLYVKTFEQFKSMFKDSTLKQVA